MLSTNCQLPPLLPRQYGGVTRSGFGLSILRTLPLSGRQVAVGGVADSRWRPVHNRDCSKSHLPTGYVRVELCQPSYQIIAADAI
jgi:hypothetical protein